MRGNSEQKLLKCLKIREYYTLRPTSQFTIRRGYLKTEVSLWKRINFSRPHYARGNKSATITRHFGKLGQEFDSRDYRDVIVFEKLYFQNVFRPYENEKLAFSNSSGFKSVFEKLLFRDGLVWTDYCGR